MRAFTLALSVVIVLVFCTIAHAQVPKFTVVSITTDPPGPLAPGAKFNVCFAAGCVKQG